MIERILRDPLVNKTIKVFVIILIIYILIIVLKWNKLPLELPLFYSLPRSTDQLGSPVQLLILPLLSIIIFLGHLILAALVLSQEKLLAKILVVESLISSLVLLITFVKIVFLIS